MSFGCSEKKDNQSIDNNQIKFEIDSSLIGERVVFKSLGLEICPPKQWEKFDLTKYSDIFKNFTVVDSVNKIQKLIHIFSDTMAKSFMFISEIVFRNSPHKNTLKEIYEDLQSSIQKLSKSYTVQIANLRKDNIELIQVLAFNNQFVNFRFFGITSHNKVFQIDYFIPKNYYTEQVARAIESSLGTLCLSY